MGPSHPRLVRPHHLNYKVAEPCSPLSILADDPLLLFFPFGLCPVPWPMKVSLGSPAPPLGNSEPVLLYPVKELFLPLSVLCCHHLNGSPVALSQLGSHVAKNKLMILYLYGGLRAVRAGATEETTIRSVTVLVA
jgi:hypothetical protein